MSARKKTAKRFGLKQPKKTPVKVSDLDASPKAGNVKGGAVKSARVPDDAHGCPACPHNAGTAGIGDLGTTTR